MEQKGQFFHLGKVAYEKLEEELFEFYKLLPLKARKELFNDKSKTITDSKDNASFKELLKEFNDVLQYTLLCVAEPKEDGKASYLEMLFIADIGDLGERLDHLLLDGKLKNDPKFNKFTYLLLPDATLDEFAYYKEKLYVHVEPYISNLLKLFAVANHISGDEMSNDLLPYFGGVFEQFLKIDGRMQSEDPRISVRKFRQIFFDQIPDYKNKVKSLLK